VALKGLSTLDINIEALSVELYTTFSVQTSIKLFTNSSNGEEKRNFPLPKELPSRTLTRRITQLKRVYKIRNKFQLKERRRKIQ
jgi:hypothetical protein